MADAQTVTLTKRTTEKGGNTSYARPGVRASVYFNKNMFKDGVTPPDSITISAEGLAEPGEVKVKELTAEQAQKLQEQAKKAEENARKAQERAAKAAAKAQAAAAKVGAAPAEQPQA